MSTHDSVPLARLFAMAFRSLIDDLHAQLAERGWRDVRPPYGFVLLAVRDRPTTATDVGHLLGLTKQAASKVLDAMEASDLIRRGSHAEDGRVKLVEITPQGGRLLRDVEAIYAGLEAEWAAVIGSAGVEALRRDVTGVLRSQNDGELPPIRPTW